MFWLRNKSTLSHINSKGSLHMVDVSQKSITNRIALAQGKVLLGKEAFELVRQNQIKKGDVLTVAKIAGIQGAKQTSNLIPLCHPLSLSKIDVVLSLEEQDHSVRIDSRVVCDGKTGVEMEAIMAVSVSACTIYDMCKAVNKSIEITDIKLLSKTGGKSGDYNII
jgi:molybdenum cofactor biosynthesis protein MoaC